MQIFFITSIFYVVLADDFWSNFQEIPSAPLESLGAIPKCGEGDEEGIYMCVPYFNCNPDTNTITDNPPVDGSNQIIPKLLPDESRKCGHYLQVCCQKTNATVNSNKNVPSVSWDFNANCGMRNPDFTWGVEIYIISADHPTCGGSIISPVAVLTAAHCVNEYKPELLKVRAGNQIKHVSQIITHEHYLNSTLYNDIAILILLNSLSESSNVGTVCLPNSNKDYNSQNCSVVRLVPRNSKALSLVPNPTCQNFLRRDLGDEFLLDHSFLCASADSEDGHCKGDGGNSLVCSSPSNLYYQVGIISWGVGCDKTDIPGVYTDVLQYNIWINIKLQELGYNSTSYTPQN